MSSCLPNSGDVKDIYYDIDSISVVNLDNTGEFLTEKNDNRMYSEAVAFQLKLLSTLPFYASEAYSQPFGLSTAKATSPIEPRTIPNQSIRKISIITMLDLNSEIAAGSNIAEEFLVSTAMHELYMPLDEYLKIPHIPIYRSFEIPIDFVLKEKVKNTEAKFKFIVELSNDVILEIETNLIEIN